MFIIQCKNEGYKTESGINLEFQQIGYFKGDNNLRYFTFHVKSSERIEENSILEDVFKVIKEHGSKQMNTSGQITASFYYIIEGSAPDISLLNSEEANKIAHARKPIAALWIMPSGQINLIKNPE